MSSYLKKGQPLEYDNAPDWLINCMQLERAIIGKSANTVNTYFLDLRGFFQWVKVVKTTGRQPRTADALRKVDILDLPFPTAVSITRNDIETYLVFLTEVLGNSPATRNKKLSSLKAFYNYVLDHKEDLGAEIDSNPAERIHKVKQPKKVPVYLDMEEQEKMLNVSGRDMIRDRAILLFLNITAVRVSELVNLDKGDIDLNAMRARIRDGKGAKERIVILPQNLCDVLEEYQNQYRDLIPGLTTKAYFVSRTQRDRLTARAIQYMVKRQGKRAGVFKVTPHKYRHTAATMLAQQGEDTLVIQQALGHESPVTTAIYTHLREEDIASAVNRSSLAALGKAE